jgi:hypothetical protein
MRKQNGLTPSVGCVFVYESLGSVRKGCCYLKVELITTLAAFGQILKYRSSEGYKQASKGIGTTSRSKGDGLEPGSVTF